MAEETSVLELDGMKVMVRQLQVMWMAEA